MPEVLVDSNVLLDVLTEEAVPAEFFRRDTLPWEAAFPRLALLLP